MRETILRLDPHLPLTTLAGLALFWLLVLLLLAWRAGFGWALWWRALAGAAVLGALANPVRIEEEREPLTDIVTIIADDSESQSIGERQSQQTAALMAIETALAGMAGVEYRVLRIGNGENGTELAPTLNRALADVPLGRRGGVILITDGRIADAGQLPPVGAPAHGLITGQVDESDRRLVMEVAPGFALVGQSARFIGRVEASGVLRDTPARVMIRVDGKEAGAANFRPGESFSIDVPITHPGHNVVEVLLEPLPGELTDRNNALVYRVNGVRDRLRVLLVSGEPHPGERTWRNLLKADPAVDLVHFTILRPPTKAHDVPVEEMSLIAFPTRELFIDKLDSFDLLIFDRFRRWGVLPSAYVENVVRYVRGGGAVLMSVGPEFAGIESMSRSPLGAILPAVPGPEMIEQPFTPTVTETGQRHPVTAGLQPGWGRWFRMAELRDVEGEVLMTGANDLPLLITNRVEKGRVALLGSDHAWLWTRGFEGGGPQAELLRRIAHWSMKEPELEEEALTAATVEQGKALRIERRGLGAAVGPLVVTTPSGRVLDLSLTPSTPGRWQARLEVGETGLYRLKNDQLEAVVAVGPPAPKEFAEPTATTAVLAPWISAQAGGGLWMLANGMPELRAQTVGRPMHGPNWLGIQRNQASRVISSRRDALLPPWLALLIAAGLGILAWRAEGRRG